MPPLVRRLACATALLLLGAVIGVAAVATHRLWWGLLLVVVLTPLLLYALPAGWWSRLPYAIGYSGVVAWTTTPRPEGDWVVGSDLDGYLLLATGVVALVTGILTLPRPRRAESGDTASGS